MAVGQREEHSLGRQRSCSKTQRDSPGRSITKLRSLTKTHSSAKHKQTTMPKKLGVYQTGKVSTDVKKSP
ncbi:hypothetical protein SRHO_G00001420 [Serrasalmus rhombeus]